MSGPGLRRPGSRIRLAALLLLAAAVPAAAAGLVLAQAEINPAPLTATDAAAGSPSGYIVVASGDTLWSIAARFVDGEHSVAQIMLAFQRANPDAFARRNINGLKLGAQLRIPAAADFGAVGLRAAYAEVRAQNSAWSRYRGETPVAAADGSTDPVAELSLLLPGDAGVADASSDPSPAVDELRTQLLLSEEELEAARSETRELASRLEELHDRMSAVGAAREAPQAAAGRADAGPEFDVRLSAQGELTIPGLPGTLRVEIAPSGSLAAPSANLVSSQSSVPAIQGSAIVEPFSTAFDINPSESQCIEVHATGSQVQFEIRPREPGSFEVGANIKLFKSGDCSGAHVPRTAKTLRVEVKVDRERVVRGKVDELGSVFWQKLLDFWGALVAIVFGLLLFLIRGRLKKWFGFESE